MQTRREFVGLAAALAESASAVGELIGAITRAAAIEPAANSSVLDAEHVVILMQENRSFDHAFGSLRGVRGYNDPRAIDLPNGDPVWVQTDAAGKRHVPFRFNIHDSKITWMGCLPHGWGDQVDARNGGRYDQWLKVKRSGERAYADQPLTLGYFTRDDIPFYYALADAFTICDQHFCSSLTGTTPNRCFLWTGTIRARQTGDSPALVRNEQADLDHLVSWPTFPERLESLGVSWKVYQNELTVLSGLTGPQDEWLSNYGDNPLEYFKQYNVYLSPRHRAFVARRIAEIPGEIESLQQQLAPSAAGKPNPAAVQIAKRIADLSALRLNYQADERHYGGKSLDKLPAVVRALHERAFTVNDADPAFRELSNLEYEDGAEKRKMQVPKGDVLHQFRADVSSGKLPTVSWIVAPQKFSDHPASAWYGAWYIAEVMNILTSNPEVWKKTVFILTYDENDGYFDHLPPFVAPHPKRTETGRTSAGIDTTVDYVELEQDRLQGWGRGARGHSIGLGYRVPMVIASPWSRGGCVCSQVFDHTSVLQFLEKLLSHKLGKQVVEQNISAWRRTVCGDLTSAFQATAKADDAVLTFPKRDAFVEGIHRAQYKAAPGEVRPVSDEELAGIRVNPAKSRLPRQEPGVRPSCPLPYELYADGRLSADQQSFSIRFAVGDRAFEEKSAGAPFVVYALGTSAGMAVRDYAVAAGAKVEDTWKIADFKDGRYHLRVYGPNGFYREFTGDARDPRVEIRIAYATEKLTDPRSNGQLAIEAKSREAAATHSIELTDNAYGLKPQSAILVPKGQKSLIVDATKSAQWYDTTIRLAGVAAFSVRCAGRVETGEWTTSDPAMS